LKRGDQRVGDRRSWGFPISLGALRAVGRGGGGVTRRMELRGGEREGKRW